MRYVREIDIEGAASLSKHGGRLSMPVDLLRFIDLRSHSTSNIDTGRKLDLFSVLLGTGIGVLQPKLQSGWATSLSFDVVAMK